MFHCLHVNFKRSLMYILKYVILQYIKTEKYENNYFLYKKICNSLNDAKMISTEDAKSIYQHIRDN